MTYPSAFKGLRGTVRTFGSDGPAYIIGELSRPLPGGEWTVSVEVPESGEIFDYELSKILLDPEENDVRHQF